MPVWLSNIVMSLDQDLKTRDWDQYGWDLLWMAPRANKWLDQNRVKDSIENRRVADRVYRYLTTGLVDFTMLRSGLLHDTAIRFRNVLEAA